MLIAPSVLDVKDEVLEEKVRALATNGADWIHLDVLDWNRTGSKRDYQIEALRCAKSRPYNVHLMVDDAKRFISRYTEIADHITIQGTKRTPKDIEQQLDLLRYHDIKEGIALNPDEPLTDAGPFITRIHHLLFMTVFSGYGGQKFIPEVVDKIKDAYEYRTQLGLTFLIGVDGGVNDQTIELIRPFADYVVAGNYVMKADDQKKAITLLRGV